MPEREPQPPTDDDRRRAACLAMGSAPGLIRFAARFTRSLHDAEDAYQRTMEIALTRAPITEPQRFMSWLHTVLRNEALAVAQVRRREGPALEADVSDAYANELEDALTVDAIAEWRERYRSIQDGLAGLTDAQRICLMLQSAGVSYERIREITGFSLRKVERSVLEGRTNLTAHEVRLASGEACERLDPMIDLVATGQASAKESRIVARHTRHCGHCRAVLRDRRESNEWLAGLVPVALLAGHAFAGTPDPTPVIAWWERVSGGATVRMGTMVQMAMDLPSSALAKVGAGTAAVAVAGAAGAPILADAVRSDPVATPVVAGTRATPPRLGTADLNGAADPKELGIAFAHARRAATAAVMHRAPHPVPKKARTTPARAAAPTTHAVAIALPPPAVPVAPPAPVRRPAPSSNAVALEFGP